MSIPTQAEYERAEQLRYCAQAQRCDAQPLADARSAQADYAERLHDPEWFARSVRLVLGGDYGWWIGKRAGEVAQNICFRLEGDGMTPKEYILARLKPHVCSDTSCGVRRRPENHTGTYELDSDDFVRATTMTEKRYDGTPQAPS